MRVAVFRAREDGERTSAALAGYGHEAVLAPVFTVVPTGAQPGQGAFDGIIFTSAHGLEALEPAALSRLKNVRCFCVGPRTARLAEEAGFTEVRSARADAETLCALVCGELRLRSRLLLVAGLDRRPTVERLLGQAGHAVTVAEIYQAAAVAAWDRGVVDDLGAGDVTAALHYSRRSAELALTLASQAGLRAGFLDMTHYCLSREAATPLVAAGVCHLVVAPEMNEASLLSVFR